MTLAGQVVPCPECGHSSDVHGVEGCEANIRFFHGRDSCPCPFLPSDILPMTRERRDEFDRNRHRGEPLEVRNARRVIDELTSELGIADDTENPFAAMTTCDECGQAVGTEENHSHG